MCTLRMLISYALEAHVNLFIKWFLSVLHKSAYGEIVLRAVDCVYSKWMECHISFNEK